MHGENRGEILLEILLAVILMALIISMAFNWRFYRRSRAQNAQNVPSVEMRPLLEAQEARDRQSGIVNMAFEGQEAFV